MINNKGFSLIELVIVTAMAIGLLMVAGSFFELIGTGQKKALQSVDVTSKLKQLDFVLPSYIEGAVNTDWTSSPIGNIGAGSVGRIREFQSQTVSSPQRPRTVGLFLREAGFPNNSITGSDLRGTALYFRNPTPTTSGELMIATSGPGIGTVNLRSDQSVFKIDGIVEFQLSRGGFQDGTRARLVQARFVLRKFLTTNENDWRWCKNINLAACETPANYNDIEHIVNIPMINNVFTSNIREGANPITRKTLLGNFYMFRFVNKRSE